jgi:hypothetical protein
VSVTWEYKCLSSNIDLIVLSIGELMQQIESTGLCDCSFPNTIYAIAAYVTTYEWGMTSVWLYVGYMYDIEASSMHVTKS